MWGFWASNEKEKFDPVKVYTSNNQRILNQLREGKINFSPRTKGSITSIDIILDGKNHHSFVSENGSGLNVGIKPEILKALESGKKVQIYSSELKHDENGNPIKTKTIELTTNHEGTHSIYLTDNNKDLFFNNKDTKKFVLKLKEKKKEKGSNQPKIQKSTTVNYNDTRNNEEIYLIEQKFNSIDPNQQIISTFFDGNFGTVTQSSSQLKQYLNAFHSEMDKIKNWYFHNTHKTHHVRVKSISKKSFYTPRGQTVELSYFDVENCLEYIVLKNKTDENNSEENEFAKDIKKKEPLVISKWNHATIDIEQVKRYILTHLTTYDIKTKTPTYSDDEIINGNTVKNKTNAKCHNCLSHKEIERDSEYNRQGLINNFNHSISKATYNKYVNEVKVEFPLAFEEK